MSCLRAAAIMAVGILAAIFFVDLCVRGPGWGPGIQRFPPRIACAPKSMFFRLRLAPAVVVPGQDDHRWGRARGDRVSAFSINDRDDGVESPE